MESSPQSERGRIGLGWLQARGAQVVFVVGVLVAVVAIHIPTLGQPLLEMHGFRQTQTAFITKTFVADGIDLLHPQTPVLGQSGQIPFEFPLFEAIATVPVNLGAGVDSAMRSTSLAFFAMAVVFLYLVTRKIFGVAAAVVATLWFSFNPLTLQWSRASLIEFMAVAFGLAMVWTYLRFRDHPRWWWLVAAAVFGAISLLTKSTTGAFFYLPVFLLPLAGDRSVRTWIRARLHPAFLISVAVPFVLTMLWNHHADAIKASDPATAWLTSDALTEWNFGTLQQRLDPGTWATIFGRVESYIIGLPVALLLVLVAIVAWRWREQRLAIGIFTLMAVAPPLVFFNLYVVHDYYLSAIVAPLSIVMGALVGYLLSIATSFAQRLISAAIAVVVAAAMLIGSHDYIATAYKGVGPGALPAAIDRVTTADETIVTNGFDWDPSMPYYADRRAQMLTARTLDDPAWVESVKAGDYSVFVVQGVAPIIVDLTADDDWVTAVDPNILRTGSFGDTVPPLASALSRSTLPPGLTGSERPAVTVACNQGVATVDVPDPLPNTWQVLSVDGAVADQAINIGAVSVPARRYLALQGALPLQVSCVGTNSLSVKFLGTVTPTQVTAS